jgi:glycosyltransferase involved in cell wall biosynthesis
MKTISVVLPIYNKAQWLPSTLKSLYEQDGRDTDFALEFVLVDDASTDNSVAICERFLAEQGVSGLILRNTENAGPSIRLNQGLHAATGSYCFVFDADDIAPANVLKSLLQALLAHDLDYIYGRSQKTSMSAETAAAQRLPESPVLALSDRPLHFTLKKGIVLPIVLVRRDVALLAGGSDEAVFVQDESLALRLALVSRRAGLFEHACRYELMTPEEQKNGRPSAQHLSANVSQQHHDQYLTYWHLLQRNDLSMSQRRALAKKAISPWWKSVRKQRPHPLVLLSYLISRFMPLVVLSLVKPYLHRHFSALANVRRVPSSISL